MDYLDFPPGPSMQTVARSVFKLESSIPKLEGEIEYLERELRGLQQESSSHLEVSL